MDPTETMLKERFDNAAGGVHPDVMRLVAGGSSEGRRLVGRRRLQAGVGAVAAVALVTGGVTYAGNATDLFGAEQDGPADEGGDRQLVQLVPAIRAGSLRP